MASRVPPRLFHGRVRTSTLALAVAFLAVLALYLVVRPDPVDGAALPGAGAVVPSQPSTSAPPLRTSRTPTSTVPTTTAPTTTAPAKQDNSGKWGLLGLLGLAGLAGLLKRPHTEVRTVETQRVDPPRDRTR